ncbi:MAG TPA: site-specific integrase [Thermomicrobiales bacterium]|nr:site-specific integrase [Thermomicrobiales bacterium]
MLTCLCASTPLVSILPSRCRDFGRSPAPGRTGGSRVTPAATGSSQVTPQEPGAGATRWLTGTGPSTGWVNSPRRAGPEYDRAAQGSRWSGSSLDLVFASSVGTPLEPSNILKRCKVLLAQAELPPSRFHDLRHSCASLLLAQGVHPKVVQEILGHSQISMTLDIYSHLLPNAQREAAERMNDVFADDQCEPPTKRG